MFQPLPQILRNVRFGGGKPLDAAIVQEAINDGQRRLGNAGRLLIRPSGTEPVIRVMAEGEDRGVLDGVVEDICSAIRKVAA